MMRNILHWFMGERSPLLKKRGNWFCSPKNRLSTAVVCCALLYFVTLSNAFAALQGKDYAPLVPDSFRHTANLAVKTETPEAVETFTPGNIYVLPLPPEVQLGLSTPPDLAIFNSDKHVLSWEARQADIQKLSLTHTLTELFPLYQSVEAGKGASLLGDDLSFMFEVTGEGKMVPKIITHSQPLQSEEKKLVGYVVEMPKDSIEPDEFIFTWKDKETGIAKFSLSTSNDLASWQYVQSASLTRLQGPSGVLETNVVTLGKKRLGKYVRLLFEEGFEAQSIEQIRFEENMPSVPALSHWTVPAAGELAHTFTEDFFQPRTFKKRDRPTRKRTTASKEEARGLVFTLAPEGSKGAMVLADIQIEGLQQGDMVGVNVWGRDSREVNFHLLGRTMLFSAQQAGRAIQNDPVKVGNYRIREIWIEPSGVVDIPENIRLSVKYRPTNLYFLAKGPTPYTLMWGGDVGPQEQAPLYALTATEAAIQAVAELSSVKLPATTEAASESTDTWKTWLIWGLLGLAIAVLLGMAFQISKSMKKNNEIR